MNKKLNSYVSNSKWFFLLEKLQDIKPDVEYIAIKLIKEDKPHRLEGGYTLDNNKNRVYSKVDSVIFEDFYIEHIGNLSSILYKDIEWLEFKTQVDIALLTENKKFEYVKENQTYKIFGYK